MDFMTPTLFDCTIAILILLSICIAFFRGFIKEVVTILTLAGGAWAAYALGERFHPAYLEWLSPDGKEATKIWGLISPDLMASFLAYATPFFIVFVILTMAGITLSSSIKALGLGPVDRLLGMLFGALRGFLIVFLCYAPFAFFVKTSEMPVWIKDSASIQVLDPTFQWAKEYFDNGKNAHDEKDEDTKASALKDRLKDLTDDQKYKNIKDIPQGDYTREEMEDFLSDGERNSNP